MFNCITAPPTSWEQSRLIHQGNATMTGIVQKPSHDLMMKLGILPMDNGLWTDTGAPVSESVHNT